MIEIQWASIWTWNFCQAATCWLYNYSYYYDVPSRTQNYKQTVCTWHDLNVECFQLDPSVALDQYGFVVASDALAQIIFAPIFGILADRWRGIRGLSFACGALFTIGNLFYANISLVPRTTALLNQPRFFAMILARLIVGTGTGWYSEC